MQQAHQSKTSSVPESQSRMASLSPPGTAFKKKQYATPSQWQTQKATIKRLYLDENRTLPEVRTTLEEEHSFHATINMYKKRLRAWGFTKNIQEHEARSLLIDQLKAANSRDTANKMKVNGRQNADKKLQRYLQRNPYLLWQIGTCRRSSDSSESSSSSSDDIEISSSPLDSVNIVHEASLSPSLSVRMSVPASTRDLERALHSVRTYIQTNQLIYNTPSTQWRRIMLGHSPNKPVLHLGADLIKFHDTFAFVADALNAQSHPAVTQLLQPHFDRISVLLKNQHPDLISSMMRMSLEMSARKRPELGKIVHNYLLEMTPLVLSNNHPMAVVWESVKRWHASEGDHNTDEFRKTIMLASEMEMVEMLRSRNITGFGSDRGPTTIGGVGEIRLASATSSTSASPSSLSLSSTPSASHDDQRPVATSSDVIVAAPAHEDAPWITDRIRNWLSLHQQWSRYQADTGNYDAEISDIVSQSLDDLSIGRIRHAEDGMRKVLEKQERVAKEKKADPALRKTARRSVSSVSRTDPAVITTSGSQSKERDDDKEAVLQLGSVPNLITWIILVLGMARVRVGDEDIAIEHFRWVIANADRRGDLVVRNIGMTMLKYITRESEMRRLNEEERKKKVRQVMKTQVQYHS